MSKKTKDKLCSICNQLSIRGNIRQDKEDDEYFQQDGTNTTYKQIPLGSYQPQYKDTMQKK